MARENAVSTHRRIPRSFWPSRQHLLTYRVRHRRVDYTARLARSEALGQTLVDGAPITPVDCAAHRVVKHRWREDGRDVFPVPVGRSKSAAHAIGNGVRQLTRPPAGFLEGHSPRALQAAQDHVGFDDAVVTGCAASRSRRCPAACRYACSHASRTIGHSYAASVW